VAPFTDPGWTPLFATAAALVSEVGGLMTHGSLVAREYGIPAVVGVVDATRRIETGQRVRVDGDAGYVEVLDDDAAARGPAPPYGGPR
jgi:phosphohistidine swiveling domain-containing protein